MVCFRVGDEHAPSVRQPMYQRSDRTLVMLKLQRTGNVETNHETDKQ